MALVVATAALAIGGCAIQRVLPLMERPEELLVLCREHNGLKIYRTAEDVEGVIFASEAGCGVRCREVLRGRIYRFVESRVHPGTGSLVDGPGVYRFTLEPIGHPRCGPFEAWHARQYPRTATQPPHIEEYEGVCIATWPIERLTTPYEVQDEGVVRRECWYGKLATRSERVIDRRDGTVMAEFQTHWVSISNRDGSIKCPVDKPGWSISDVLKPAEQ